MKIGALLPHLQVYGGVRRYIEMGNEFVRRGHAFTIFHSDGSRPTWVEYRGATAPIEAARTTPQDVVFCGDSGQLPLLGEVPARLRVMHILGPRYVEKYRACYRPEFVVVGLQSEWKRYLPGIPGYTVNGGINPEVFRPVPAKKDPAVFTVAAFGRLRKEHKGTRFVIEAMKSIRDRRVRLLLFDDQPIDLPWLARGLEIETVIDPPQEKMPEMYCRCDAFVSAELAAGWSNSTAEAMACAVPVVCTTSGTVDFALPDRTALVVPPSDASAIAVALRRLIEDPEWRRRIGEAGRQEILKHTWAQVVDRLGAIFAEKGVPLS